MDTATPRTTADDLSALAWVHGELRRSLETAHKALRRYLRDAEAISGSDIDAVDPAVLRAARAQLHQGVGALELVGMPAVADVLRASEAAVQRMVARPAMLDSAAVETIERVSFALLDFIARQLAGKPVSPVMLFPQYRAVLQLAAADRIHPADLWKVDWQWRELPADGSAQPRLADDAARSDMETLVLALLRDPGRGAQTRMSDLCADLGAGARHGTHADLSGASAVPAHLATLWQLAAAVFEAQAATLLATDVYSKRLASRLMAQLRMQVRGQGEVSDRLAQDLLFFCSHAQAPSAGQPAPRLAAVRKAWGQAAPPTADYETQRLGRHDPAVMALARKRVAAAKDSWSAVAGGELHRMTGLAEQFALVGESLQRLLPDGGVLAQALQTAVTQTVASAAAPPPALAMEVATGVLYLDASLEDGDFDHPELAARVQRLARRIDDVRIGAEPQALDTWMEELYRRVSDRQTMGSVVQELRASLSEIEKQIDQYFRDPTQRELLIPVPAQLSAMRGVLSVLGLEHASAAALHMRDEVDALAQTEVDPHQAIRAGTFDRLADNLGALSFLIDMLSVQPALAKSLFRYDPESGSLSAVMGQSERISAFAAFDEPGTAPAPAPLAQVPLLEQLQAVAVRAAEPAVADDAIARLLEPLAAQAYAAEQPDLARLLGSAQRTLRGLPGDAADRATRAAMRSELAAAAVALAPPPAPELPASAPIPPAAPPVAGGGTGLEDDVEMREIFIEEAREVVADARTALERLADAPDSATDMTAVRRAFHTLKGSSRMLGLRDFGDAAWACEQLYNARLAQAPRMEHALRQFTAEALDYMADWTEAIATSQPRGHTSAAVARAADALRVDNERVTIAAPLQAAPPAPAAAPGATPQQPAAVEMVGFDFELDGLTDAADTVLVDPDADSVDADTDADADADAGAGALPSLETLITRVPDLPSAADLDLQLPALRAAERSAVLPPAPPADTLNFEFDLDLGPDAGPDADVRKPAPAALPELAFDAPPPPEPAPPALPVPDVQTIDMDPADIEQVFADEAAPLPAEAESETAADDAAAPRGDDDEQVRVIGDLRIGIPLFNIFLNEADELSRRLGIELAEWALESERRAVPDSSAALAHSLAGNSATVGYGDLSAVARALEHALMRSHTGGRGRVGEPALFSDAADEIRRLLHLFAAGFLRPVAPELMDRLAAHERLPQRDEAADAAAAQPALAEAADDIDAELFPIFEEEADELLPQLQARLRDWRARPADSDAAMACMRTLHTVKGGARLAGAARLGDMAHRLEADIEALTGRGAAHAADIEPLLAAADAMSAGFETLRRSRAAPAAARPAAVAVDTAAQPSVAASAPAATAPADEAVEPARGRVAALLAPPATDDAAAPTSADAAPAAPAPAPAPAALVLVPSDVDWQRFTDDAQPGAVLPAPERGAGAVVRVRAGALDRMVNQAGEVSIARARIDGNVKQLQGALGELTDSLERMRRQLRDIELQAESQISSRLEAAKAAAQLFDPLEMDRFTRFQELTRFMAESVNDVATLQRSLQRTLQSTEDELAAQARLTRELQDDLLRTRMVEFESMADRLHRTARQAARDTGKQARLEIVGGAIEIDRGVLERMAGSFEHLLRNSVAHGIESPQARSAAGKDAVGLITVTVAQAGNEVAVEFADDGAGIDAARIRQRAVERGLLAADANLSDAELTQFIFSPGFSTAETVTELAGRGVGLDVVRAEVTAMGGRIETTSEPGRGTRLRLLLPLTTAVTQIVMLRCGELQVAVPSPLIETVRRVPSADVERAYGDATLAYADEAVPFFWLAALLDKGTRGDAVGRNQTVVVVRSAAQRVAVHVDEVVGNQEVVVKNIGQQLSHLPGLAGVTLLPSGQVALIYNPVALASLYGDAARARMQGAASDVAGDKTDAEPAPQRAALVLVVDDSLTVRRVTQRLLVREGYRVVTAKDGLEALERLAEERPVVLLSDIEMPRMDGFDLLRNVRADSRLAGLPVVMITSRTAQKHRDHAAALGADHYLGKPYAEEELLALVARYAGADIPS